MPKVTEPPELETIRIDAEGDVGVLTLNRPALGNSIDARLVSDMISAFSWTADRAAVSAVILTGSGGNFCGGYDAEWSERFCAESDDLPSSVRFSVDFLHRAIVELRRIPVPIVAAIDGRAAGVGVSLALACDTRIATDRASLDFRFEAPGQVPHGGLTFFLPRAVSPSKAFEILLEPRQMDSATALQNGLVRSVTATPDDLLSDCRDHALALADLYPRGCLQRDLQEFRFDAAGDIGK